MRSTGILTYAQPLALSARGCGEAMSDGSAKPVIFISFSHKDEPEKPGPDEVAWLSFVQSFLAPAVQVGIFDIWVDENLHGGDKIDPVVATKLAECDIFVVLVSRHSLASSYVVETEIAAIRKRQKNGDDVHIFPIVLSPTPETALKLLKDLLASPKDGKPLSLMSLNDREVAMAAIADDIANVAGQIFACRNARFDTSENVDASPKERSSPAGVQFFVDVTHLPETAYERLVGREIELERLDKAWADGQTNIVSLIGEGGAGKSALINEWLKRICAESYRGAEAILGWSFYSQGTKERATSAEQFLNWTLEKLGVQIETTSATAKGEAIAEELMKRRVLLLLDGCEPLQHGLDSRQGELKDRGLRVLLRRFASMPPAKTHGLIVLSSRLSIKDVAGWKDSSASVAFVDKLSDEAGAALLRDNGVWGTDKQLRAAARDFGGHPLALGLLASFLKETQVGDARRRDHIRQFFADTENPRHDHAKRVMESYEREWLTGHPVEYAIMLLMGLFDRPASEACLRALRKKPAIIKLTDAIVDLGEREWQRAVARLRDVRLLAPLDPSAPTALDAHPLIREWFGERLLEANRDACRAAHSRLYDHLRRTTREGDHPSLDSLAPLYQAIAHGCRAGRHSEALRNILVARISRGEENYANHKLAALGTNLAALSWFFDRPYEATIAKLSNIDRSWVLGAAAYCLRAQGRFVEAMPADRTGLRIDEEGMHWANAAIGASNICEGEMLAGNIMAAITIAQKSVSHADRSGDNFLMIISRTALAEALCAAGQHDEAERVYVDAERRQGVKQPNFPHLYSVHGHRYCDFLLEKGDYAAVIERAKNSIIIARRNKWLLDIALDTLTIGLAYLGLALENAAHPLDTSKSNYAFIASSTIDEALDALHAANDFVFIPRGLLARAILRRSTGDWNSAARALDEMEEIVSLGPMKLHLCDAALQRVRLAFARIEGFAPLNCPINEGSSNLLAANHAEAIKVREVAEKNLIEARGLINECSYHRRDKELAELEAVMRGERKFADLPPRV